MIFRFVSIRQSIPFSILEIVIGETLAFLESSALLIMRDSLIFFTKFWLICINLKKKNFGLYQTAGNAAYFTVLNLLILSVGGVYFVKKIIIIYI